MTVLLLAGCVTGPVDPPEALVGERLFVEPRFAQFFAVNAEDLNTPLDEGDPVMDVLARDGGDVEGPFAGSTMSCRQCHLVDDVRVPAEEAVRTYADFAQVTPIPDRGDGLTHTPRNTPALVDASVGRDAPFVLHFDGEFPSGPALVRGTFTGRNLGWLATEHDDAVAHVASVVRADDGTFPLVVDGATWSYRDLFAGDPGVPDRLRIPEALRVDVDAATDDEVLDAVAALVTAYMDNILYARGLESGLHEGSPYDLFLLANDLPRAPEAGEDGTAYAQRLLTAIDALETPAWITDVDGRFTLHRQEFRFGAAELRGLRIFLTAPADGVIASTDELTTGAVGNCAACHVPPEFTDYAMHNTGVSQETYDAVWGDGAFAALTVPDLATRDADPEAWLPGTSAHPAGTGLFRSLPSADAPGAADLGAWNIYANDDHADLQDALATLVDAAASLPSESTEAERLDRAIALFKTPSVRDLAQSAPYLHDGTAPDLDAVLAHYVRASDAERAGTLRNGDPRLAGVALTQADLADLRAFLVSLTEDYE